VKIFHPARPNRISSFILFAAVALAPLPFGSADPPTIAFWCIVLGLGAITVSPRDLHKVQLVFLAGVGFLAAAYAFVLHEQLSAHPWIAAPHPLWREASEALGMQLEPSVSLARNQPYFALGAPLAAVLSLIIALIVCADRDRARQFLKWLAWSGWRMPSLESARS